MTLTRRQIALIVASILVYKEQSQPPDVEFYQELDELIELLDEEHQTLIGE